MSQENVQLVLGLQPRPDGDFARLIRDDATFRRYRASSFVTKSFHSDVEFSLPRFDSEKTYTGIDGLRALWLEWLAPWATYRSSVEQAIDLGDRVLVLVRDFARREESTQEVALTAAAVWTVRDGKIARAEFYAERAQAFKAVGLSEPTSPGGCD